MDWEDGSYVQGNWALPFHSQIRSPAGHLFYAAARLLPRGNFGWALEMWRNNEGKWGWEFVAHFTDLEEAKRVGYTLARIEN